MDTSLGIARALVLPLALPAAVAIVLAGCASNNEQQLPSEVTTALEMAFNRGDIQACADLYTDDAEIISNRDHPVVGKKAIGEFFQREVSPDLLFDTDAKITVVSGNVAMEQG